MRSRSMKQGFMEPTGRGLYYENRYLSSPRNEKNDLEARKYDLCEDSSDDSTEELQVQYAQKTSRHMNSYGSINKPKYRQPSYKIAPNRNAKHSVATTQKAAEAAQETHEDLEGQAGNMTTNTFAQEKAQQQTLSSLERFESTRKKRLETRVKRQEACEKARKIRQRALKDVAAAQECLVDSVPMASSSHVLVKRSEVPASVDFVQIRSRRSLGQGNGWNGELQGATRNWKGEKMDLGPGGAYVVIDR